MLDDGRLALVDPGDDVARFLKVLDVFLLTSVPRSEGVSTTVLEAMATGVPVVATDVGGLDEVVENGRTGYVVPPLRADAIAAAALRLIRDPILRAEFGHPGAQDRRRALCA